MYHNMFGDTKTKPVQNVQVITRDKHNISRKLISPAAIKVLYRLHNSGYSAFLVGGAVRDLLLDLQPKDFDVVTNATPEQVKALFSNCRLIGRRFRLAHILFGREIIEVATFRGHHDALTNESGRVLRDNVYGSIDEDAERRDFSVNALYYNIKDFSIISYSGAIDDINNKKIKMIGSPIERYKEDPVRMLRAIRFATKLEFELTKETADPIKNLAYLLNQVPPTRMLDEVSKMFLTGKGLDNFNLMREYGVFSPLFPLIDALFESEPLILKMTKATLKNSDTRVEQDQSVSPTFFYAAILWYPCQFKANDIATESSLPLIEAYNIAMDDILKQQCKTISIPKAIAVAIKEIWMLQLRFEKNSEARAQKVVTSSRFRAAIDLLILRSACEANKFASLIKWWHQFVLNNKDLQKAPVKSQTKTYIKPRRKPKT